MDYALIAYGALGGAAYGYEIYRKKKASDPALEPDYPKLLGTIAIGAGVGALVASSGKDVDLLTVEGAFVVFGEIGLTALIENTARLVTRWFENRGKNIPA